MESKKINQLATELTPALSDLTIIGDPSTGISKKITLSQMASLFTGTVEEYANLAAFPLVGVADTIYIALDTNVLYRWDTTLTSYVELSPNIINSLVFNDANGFDGTIALVGSVATLTITTALTTGSVGFIGASGALLQDNANFFWDDTNNRLGLGTNAPTTTIDVFGSGIIGRLNGTSTNNSFLGFASAGTNKWSIGNVQSDHRFRIYSEANTAELVSVLQTGEFGIGIANPTTKLHIDGGASALIANLDANVSVAKSVSFRSDNSARFNIEVSGTESGTNAGANFFIRRYSDAGSLIDTPLTITRSTGAISLATALSGTTASFTGSIIAESVGFIGIIPTYTSDYVSFSHTSRSGANNYSFLSGIDGETIVNAKTGKTIDFRINNGTKVQINSTGYTTITGPIIGNIFSWTDAASNTGHLGIRSGGASVGADGNLYFETAASERGRFTSGGYLKASNNGNYAAPTGTAHEFRNTNENWVLELVNAHGSVPYGLHMYYSNTAPNSSSGSQWLWCEDTVNIKAAIYSNGTFASRTSTYGGFSDIKLKENIKPATSKLDDLLKVNVVNYNFIDDSNKEKQIGVVAQELETIFPNMIFETDDYENIEIEEEDENGNITKKIEKKELGTKTKSVKYSIFIPMLIKAMQEQQAQIEELKALINK